MAPRYEPQFSSKKRLAHLGLRERPTPQPTAEEAWRAKWGDRHTRCLCGRPLYLCERTNRRCWQGRAQAMLDRRRSKGEQMLRRYDEDRDRHMSPYRCAILP